LAKSVGGIEAADPDLGHPSIDLCPGALRGATERYNGRQPTTDRLIEGGFQVLSFFVTKRGETKDREFEAYSRLLTDVGIDVSNAPRVREPGVGKRWLYAWSKKIEAERFAAELRRRTGDARWIVQQTDVDAEERGPVAPLEIARTPEEDGYTYYLTPASRERVSAAYPGTKLPLTLKVGIDKQHDLIRQQGDNWWMELACLLTGRNEKDISLLGGFRVVVGEDAVAFQWIPAAASTS
jgi:hypothetical protein